MQKHGTASSVGQFAELSATVIKALPRQIPPKVLQMWGSNGAWLEQVLLEALCPPSVESIQLSGWKTLLTQRIPASVLMERLENAQVAFGNENPMAIELLRETKTPSVPRHNTLVRPRVFELGFEKNPTTAELYDRIKMLGSLCSIHDAFFLAAELAAKEELRHETVYIATEPVQWEGSSPMIPVLERRYAEDPLSFALTMAPLEWTWTLETRFVFRKNT